MVYVVKIKDIKYKILKLVDETYKIISKGTA